MRPKVALVANCPAHCPACTFVSESASPRVIVAREHGSLAKSQPRLERRRQKHSSIERNECDGDGEYVIWSPDNICLVQMYNCAWADRLRRASSISSEQVLSHLVASVSSPHNRKHLSIRLSSAGYVLLRNTMLLLPARVRSVFARVWPKQFSYCPNHLWWRIHN